MKNSALRRYERELQKSVRGVRLKRAVRSAFHCSLSPLLDEHPDPDYLLLTQAFGPPDGMAQILIGAMVDPPKPLRRTQKVALTAGLCLVVALIGFGAFTLWNTPEEGRVLTTVPSYPEATISDMSYAVSESFSHSDVFWEQPKKMDNYLLEIHNTGDVRTKIYIQYTRYQPPHSFVVPAGENRAFVVNNARAGIHTISFTTPDGSLSGTVQVRTSNSTL